MRVTIVIEQAFGHPANRPTKKFLLQSMAIDLPKALEKVPNLSDWGVTSITVE